MKIAYIGLRGVPASYGGIERAVEELGTRVARLGHEVTVYCMKTYYPDRPPSYEGMRLKYVSTMRRKNLEMICYAFLSALDASLRRYDIVHLHALGPSTMTLLPRLAGRGTVVTVHGLDWQREKWGRLAKGYLKFGEFSSYRFPQRTICVSKSLQDYYRRTHDCQADYIPNGVNFLPLLPLEEAAKKYGIEKQRYFLMVSRLTKEKNVHLLVEAFRRIRTDIKLMIVGGSSHTDEYVQSVKKAAEGDSRIIFTGPIYDKQMLAEIFSNAYVFVLPSALEGLPVVLMEALSYRNPVLVSDIAENVEVIEEDGAMWGFTCEANNVDSLEAVLRNLVEKPQLVEAMRPAGVESTKRKYDWDNVARQTIQLYEEVLGQRA